MEVRHPNNSETYSKLLSQYQPEMIKTEEENEHFLPIVEYFLSRPHLTPEEHTLLELLMMFSKFFASSHSKCINFEKV